MMSEDKLTFCYICRVNLRKPYIQCLQCRQVDALNFHQQHSIDDVDKLQPNSTLHRESSARGDPKIEDVDDTEAELLSKLCQPVFICAVCFSTGRSIGLHESDHPYTIVRDDFQVLPGSNWTAKEELCLLDAVTAQGVGNWDEISKAMRTRSAKDCERHYQHFYLCGQEHGMPDVYNIPEEFSCFAPVKIDYGLAPRPSFKTNGYCEMAGYMPARADFVVEYDNNAELLVTDVDVYGLSAHGANEDATLYHEVSLSVIDVYRRRILERVRRKRIIRDYGLLNFHTTEGYFRGLIGQLPSHLVDSLKRLMRLQPAEMFMKYVESLRVEVHIRQQIRQLTQFRAEGMTRLHHVKVYETLTSRRLETQRRRRAFTDILSSLQDRETWQKWVQQHSIADKLASGGAVPHPALSRRAAPPLEIVGLPGYEKISKEERELCSTARLPPSAYLDFKRSFINECKKEGYLRLAKARTLIKIDVNKTRKIYDFLLKQNLINKDPL